MHAYVLSFESDPGAEHPEVPQRLDRLINANWRLASEQTGYPSATVGQATVSEADEWIACGLSLLTNSATLREMLESSETDDIALIAKARAKFGPSFHEQLSGGFSVVLINRKTGHVEGYRDHFGVIPFYYCVRQGVLTCGSDIRSVLHLSALPLTDEKTRIADFLFAEDVDPKTTAFSGLIRLPAAHRLILRIGHTEVERYWTCEQPPMIAVEDAAAGLRERLTVATVECVSKMIAPGAMLSGGLDSSSLTALAAKALHEKACEPLPALSFVYDKASLMDESEYIDAVNKVFSTEPLKIHIQDAPKLHDLSDLIEEQMDLFLGFGIPKSRRIYEEAAHKDISVLIDGHGGDEVISHGHDRLIELAADRKWWQLFREMQGSARIYGTSIWGPLFWYAAQYGGFPEKHFARRVLIRLARQLLPRTTMGKNALSVKNVIATHMCEGIDPDTRYAQDSRPKTQAERLSAERIAHLRTLRDPRVETAFEALHRSAVQQGVLPMYPFFDRAVVEFCLSVPSAGKLRDGQTRWVLREAMRGVLPESVRARSTKTAFDKEFNDSVIAYLERTCDDAFTGLERYTNHEDVLRLRDSVMDSKVPDVDALRLCWRLAVLRQWALAFENWKTLQSRGELI